MRLKASSARKSEVDEAFVTRTLLSIASILLRLGLNAPIAEKLLRNAFVRAADRIARANEIHATQSQIASMAGVSRLEVRRILRGTTSDVTGVERHASRVDQVLSAWRTAPAFIDIKGKPRPLQLRGSNPSFAKLVRAYGRDVTIKTLKDQLVRSGAAVEREGYLILSRPSKRRPDSFLAAKSDLRFLESQLREFDLRLGRRAYVTKLLSVKVNDRKTAYRVQREALAKIQLMLNALTAIASSAGTSAKASTRSQNRVLITATVARECEEKSRD